MSIWDFVDEMEGLAHEARGVKDRAERVIGVATSGKEKLDAVRRVQDRMQSRAQQGKLPGTFGFLFEVGKGLLGK